MKTKRQTPRTHWLAELRAREVHTLRSLGLKQREIAIEQGITRDLVAQYLSPRNKAALRAGLFPPSK